MSPKGCSRLVPLVALALLLSSACSGGSSDASQGTPSQGASTQAPTALNVAVIFESPLEDGWNSSFVQSWDRVTQAAPHGLSINVDYSENIALPDGERVLRQLAQSGKYQIIVAHSSYSDAVGVLRTEFPDIEWVLSGSGNKAYGGNVYWIDTWLHEADYLLGIIAGMMTKTNVIGTVAAFPYPNVNMYLNGFADGARSVNPDVAVKATYIGSWFDPPKAKEAAAAQIAAGADFIYAESFGVFQAVLDNPGTYAFGHYVDQNQLSPNIIVSSDLSLWDPAINQLIDAWWNHVTQGAPYNAAKSRIVALMKDGGVDIAPFHGLASLIPQSVTDAVNQARSDIISGKLVVPEDQKPLASG